MIDWERVDELRDEVGADDFAEVVELFLEEVDEVIERLRSAPDPASFEAELHFLKGCALNLGFSAFSVLCGNGEKTAAGGHPASIDIAAVVDSFDRSRAEFLSRLEISDAA
jgi:HPt (histidine-containing phosphotransfer) domain-containing protein